MYDFGIFRTNLIVQKTSRHLVKKNPLRLSSFETFA